jgi:hypothetical protein
MTKDQKLSTHAEGNVAAEKIRTYKAGVVIETYGSIFENDAVGGLHDACRCCTSNRDITERV